MIKQLKNDVNAPTRVIRFRIEVGLGVFWVWCRGFRVEGQAWGCEDKVPNSEEFFGLRA